MLRMYTACGKYSGYLSYPVQYVSLCTTLAEAVGYTMNALHLWKWMHQYVVV